MHLILSNINQFSTNMIRWDPTWFDSALMWFDLIQYDLIQHRYDSVWSNVIRFSTNVIWLSTIRFNLTQYGSIQHQYDLIQHQYDSIWSSMTQFSINVIRFDPIWFNSASRRLDLIQCEEVHNTVSGAASHMVMYYKKPKKHGTLPRDLRFWLCLQLHEPGFVQHV